MTVRKATYADLSTLMKIFEGAKQIMRDSGNIHQWNGAYPTEDVVMNDMENGNCYVLCEDEAILGTMALIPGPDPTYSYIEGEWPDDAPYYVIHRIATEAPGKNVATKLFDWAFGHIATQGCNVIRIDTHKENKIMKHILSKYGFMMCGVIYHKDGAPRDAYHLLKQATS